MPKSVMQPVENEKHLVAIVSTHSKQGSKPNIFVKKSQTVPMVMESLSAINTKPKKCCLA